MESKQFKHRIAITIARAVAASLAAAVLGAAADGQETVRASVDSAGIQGDAATSTPAISSDGTVVAFRSDADNLVPFDNNGLADVFVHDLVTGVTLRASVSSAGIEANSASNDPALSANGRYVGFWSTAGNLVAGDSNGTADVFVFDAKTATTERVSVDSAGNQGNSGSYGPSFSTDGSVIAFESVASNLVAGDTNGVRDVFVRDLVSGTTERVSVSSAGAEGDMSSSNARISGDGTVVVFQSDATNLVAGDTNGVGDVYVHDRASGKTFRVSIAWNGAEPTAACFDPVISADAKVVAFTSTAPNLVRNDFNAAGDIFVVDRSGAIERADVDSSGAESQIGGFFASISADGRYVTFASASGNLVAGDTNAKMDLFVRDRAALVTWRASLAADGSEGDDASTFPAIAGDGLTLVFQSDATNLVAGDTNKVGDALVHSETAAAWDNYGAGFPGTLGVPPLLAESDPVLGAALTLDLANSAGVATPALLVVGFAPANVPTSAGGTLLVDGTLWIPLPIPAPGLQLNGAIPDDESLCGLPLYLQALEADGGAAHGISFTRGLELILGR